jgi:hypothetical protein
LAARQKLRTAPPPKPGPEATITAPVAETAAAKAPSYVVTEHFHSDALGVNKGGRDLSAARLRRAAGEALAGVLLPARPGRERDQLGQGGRLDAAADQLGLAAFGPDIATWKAYYVVALVDQLAPSKIALYFDCGTEDDFALQDNVQYVHEALAARHVEHEFFLGPGRHDFAFWRARLPKSLAFLRDHIAKPQ